MNHEELYQQIIEKESFLCIGLDTDIEKIPSFLKKKEYPLFEFNKSIIDNTYQYAIAYKINTAFYESIGTVGWENFEKTVKYIRNKYPNIFVIADAKRGDIGNTSNMYAKAFFKTINCDAITVSPYMGQDSISPFLNYPDKWIIILALTSNEGSSDFQTIIDKTSEMKLYEKVINITSRWGNKNNIMYVVGATKAEMLKNIRNIIPDNFILVPGIGAQGGSLEDVVHYGINKKCGLIINNSRNIIYADNSNQYAVTAAQKAHEMQIQMSKLLKTHGII